jgi:hypothetical protein
MPSISGSFTGHAAAQSSMSVSDAAHHELNLMQITAMQRSTDPDWDNCHMCYWGAADLHEGNGMQRGYFTTYHSGGDRDFGTFEGRITTIANQMTIEGTWKFTSGTGKYEGLAGNGTFKGRMTAPGVFEDTWEGNYELAEETRAA